MKMIEEKHYHEVNVKFVFLVFYCFKFGVKLKCENKIERDGFKVTNKNFRDYFPKRLAAYERSPRIDGLKFLEFFLTN